MSAAVEAQGPDPPKAESALKKTLRSKSDSESGSESGARPVRRQLEKTNITKPTEDAVMTTSAPAGVEHAEQPPVALSDQNGGPSAEDAPVKTTTKKRSFDDLNDQESRAADDQNARAMEGRALKRSRDVRSGDFSGANGARLSPEPGIRETNDEDMKSEKDVVVSDKVASEEVLARSTLTSPEKAKLKIEDEEMHNVDTGKSGHVAIAKSSAPDEPEVTSPSQTEAAPAQQSKRDLSPHDAKRAEPSDVAGARARTSPSPSRSPKKRSRDHLDEDYQREQKLAATDETVARRSMEDERPELASIEKASSPSAETKEPEKSPAKAAPASGFANTSVTSPFKSIAGGSSWLKPSNAENKKPVGLGSSTQHAMGEPRSLFKPNATSSTQASAATAPAPSASPFGSLAGANAMPSSGSKGVFGSGFASGFSAATPSKLSSFAAPQGDVKAKPPTKQPFGAPVVKKEEDGDDEQGQDDETEADDADAAKEEALSEKSEPSNAKFSIQETATGEEDEHSIFTGRAKLYAYQPAKGAWAERGVGPIKLNQKLASAAPTDGSSAGPDTEARLVMRAAATHKVILNAQIFKAMKIGDKDGHAPTGKQLAFSATIDGALVPCLVKMAKAEDVMTLYKAASKVKEAL